MNKRGFNTHYIDALVVLFLGIGIIVTIPFQVKTYSGMEDGLASPTLFPYIIGGALIILALFRLIVVTFKIDKQGFEITKRQFLKFIPRFGTVVLYLLLMPFLGFVISTILAMFFLIEMLGKTKWYNALLLSAATSIIIFFSFKELLEITLPYGVLGV